MVEEIYLISCTYGVSINNAPKSYVDMLMHRLILFLTHPHMRALWSWSTAILMPTQHCFEIQIYLEERQRRLNLGPFGHSFNYKGKRLQLLGPGTIKRDWYKQCSYLRR